METNTDDRFRPCTICGGSHDESECPAQEEEKKLK